MTETLETTMTDESTIERKHLPELYARVAAIAKRAAKIGVEPMTVTVVREWERVGGPSDGHRNGLVIPMVDVRVDGTMPCLPGGWRVVAVIDHVEGGNVIRALDEATVEQYRDATPTCDHCGTNRRRNHTVVVVNEAGEIARVGSGCLRDFLGFGYSPVALLGYISETGGFMGHYTEVWTVREIVHLAAIAIDLYGYGRTDSESSTRSVVEHVLCRPTKDETPAEKEMRARVASVYETRGAEYDERTAEIIAWAAASTETSSYAENLRAIARSETLDAKHWGLAVSMPQAWTRAMEREANRVETITAATAPAPEGRVTFTGEVVSLKVVDSDYGSTTKMIVRVTNADGAQWKVWVTRPESLAGHWNYTGMLANGSQGREWTGEAGVGCLVTMTATLTRSDRDEAFVFGKRPSGATLGPVAA